MALNLEQPKDFDKNLIAWVQAGDWHVHVIDYRRWERLPANLKAKYYPLFDRSTTPYRMKPEFMKPRQDQDPNRQVVTRVVPKKVILPTQGTGDIVRALPHKPVVSTNPSTSDTEISKKSRTQMLRELLVARANPRVGQVNTRYSKY